MWRCCHAEISPTDGRRKLRLSQSHSPQSRSAPATMPCTGARIMGVFPVGTGTAGLPLAGRLVLLSLSPCPGTKPEKIIEGAEQNCYIDLTLL